MASKRSPVKTLQPDRTITRLGGKDKDRVVPLRGRPPAWDLEEVFLFGELTDEKAAEIVRRIGRSMVQGDGLRLWICSVGGDVGGGLAIYDALGGHPDAEAIATGTCQSAALLAFLGAERRWCTPNTIFYNHSVRSDLGQFLPAEFSLAALTRLEALPQGTFGPDEARKCGLVLKAPITDAGSDAEWPVDEKLKAGML